LALRYWNTNIAINMYLFFTFEWHLLSCSSVIQRHHKRTEVLASAFWSLVCEFPTLRMYTFDNSIPSIISRSIDTGTENCRSCYKCRYWDTGTSFSFLFLFHWFFCCCKFAILVPIILLAVALSTTLDMIKYTCKDVMQTFVQIIYRKYDFQCQTSGVQCREAYLCNSWTSNLFSCFFFEFADEQVLRNG
jgi:hypothetical protein